LHILFFVGSIAGKFLGFSMGAPWPREITTNAFAEERASRMTPVTEAQPSFEEAGIRLLLQAIEADGPASTTGTCEVYGLALTVRDRSPTRGADLLAALTCCGAGWIRHSNVDLLVPIDSLKAGLLSIGGQLLQHIISQPRDDEPISLELDPIYWIQHLSFADTQKPAERHKNMVLAVAIHQHIVDRSEAGAASIVYIHSFKALHRQGSGPRGSIRLRGSLRLRLRRLLGERLLSCLLLCRGLLRALLTRRSLFKTDLRLSLRLTKLHGWFARPLISHLRLAFLLNLNLPLLRLGHLHLRLGLVHLNLRGSRCHIYFRLRHSDDNFGLRLINGDRGGSLPNYNLWHGLADADLRSLLLHPNLSSSLFSRLNGSRLSLLDIVAGFGQTLVRLPAGLLIFGLLMLSRLFQRYWKFLLFGSFLQILNQLRALLGGCRLLLGLLRKRR
jgi:hypothetical protein